MDEFSKTMVAAAVGGGLTILGGIITKVLDFWFATLQEKRDFVRSGKEKAREEIEELKNQVGTIYELSINWNTHMAKHSEYEKFFAKDYEVIGRFNKYPDIATAASERDRDRLILSGEQDRIDLDSTREALRAQYQAFIQTCDKYIESLA
jgi:hypothetical protein